MAELASFYDEEIVQVGDVTLRLAIDFSIIRIIEATAISDRVTPMPEVVAMLFADPPALSILGVVFYALLRRHHDDISMDQAAGVMFGEHAQRVGMAMYQLIVRSMNLTDTSKKAKDKNPRKPRGASKPS
jgi:hypothetical protein